MYSIYFSPKPPARGSDQCRQWEMCDWVQRNFQVWILHTGNWQSNHLNTSLQRHSWGEDFTSFIGVLTKGSQVALSFISVDDLFNTACYALACFQSPGDEYFHRGVLDITEGLEVMGGLRWKLVLALFGAWLITFCVICKGEMRVGEIVGRVSL